MTDPVRWSQTPDLPEELARALDAGRTIEPPQGAQQQVLQGVLGAVGVGVAAATISVGVAKAATNAGSIAAAGAGGTAAATTTTTSVIGLTSVKLAALALGSVGVLTATVALQPPKPVERPAITVKAHAPRTRAHERTAPAVVVPEAPALQEPEPIAIPAEPVPEAIPERAARSERSVPAASTRNPVPDAQQAVTAAMITESQLVLEARARFRAGDDTGALASLDAADRAGGPSVLSQERALLRIRILQRLGRTKDARAKAALFVRVYPNSPYAAELRALSAPAAELPAQPAAPAVLAPPP